MIKLILSIVFAEESDLGWDQTIKADYRGNVPVFDIEISGRHYKTNESNIISEYNEDRIFNSGSRIFKAFDVKDKAKKNPLIIKDHWVMDLLDSEDDIQKMILEDIAGGRGGERGRVGDAGKLLQGGVPGRPVRVDACRAPGNADIAGPVHVGEQLL